MKRPSITPGNWKAWFMAHDYMIRTDDEIIAEHILKEEDAVLMAASKDMMDVLIKDVIIMKACNNTLLSNYSIRLEKLEEAIKESEEVLRRAGCTK